MPAWELLEAFDLLALRQSEKMRIVSEEKDRDGYRTIHIEIAKPDTHSPQGLEILHHELGETCRFVLLYNEIGHLLAVYPFAGKRHRSSRRYFDFSAYYFEVPKVGDPQAHKKWGSFRRRWVKDQDVVERLSIEYQCYIDKNRKESPYLYVELLSDIGFNRRCFFEFTPGSIHHIDGVSESSPLRQSPHVDQFIFPLFPTVYSPMEYQSCDSDYYRVLFKSLKRIAAGEAPAPEKILIMGPGTGFEVLIVSHFLPESQIYIAGINPLEIANTKATARFNGIKLPISKVHNNILSPEGTFVFDEQFDLVLWNMPALQDVPNVRQGFFPQFWDGLFETLDMMRFLQGLSRVLKRNGQSLIWNTDHLARRRNEFKFHGLEISEKAVMPRDGQNYRIFNVTHAIESSI